MLSFSNFFVSPVPPDGGPAGPATHLPLLLLPHGHPPRRPRQPDQPRGARRVRQPPPGGPHPGLQVLPA